MKKILFGFIAVMAASAGATTASAGKGGVSTSGCGLGYEQSGASLGGAIPGLAVRDIATGSPSNAANCGANHG